MPRAQSTTRARALLIGLQLVYVNLALAAGAYLYELLPRILNVLLGYFVAPIALLVLFNVAAGRLVAALKIELGNEGAPVTAFGVVALTLWIGLGLGAYLDVYDYVALRTGDHVEDLDPAAAPEHAGAAVLSFTSGTFATEHLGLERRHSVVKSADVTTDTYHDYVAAPPVSPSWSPSEPISVWFCRSFSGLEQLPAGEVLDGALARLPAEATSTAPIHALAMRDPATRSECAAAIEQAQSNTGIHAHSDALILRFTDLDRDALLAATRRPFWLFWAICSVLGLLPAVFVRLES